MDHSTPGFLVLHYHLEWPSSFPYFPQFQPEFCNKELMTEPQSTPGLVFADYIELLCLLLQRT